MTDSTADWRATVEREREEKDNYIGKHPQSPLSTAERKQFQGLSYFPIDEQYRFERELQEYDEKEPLTVQTTADGEREYLRWGEFRFEIDGEGYVLEAYRSDPSEDRFWVPFRDDTNGHETYDGGRYLDLEGAEDQTSDGKWILDFNRAYNPFCVYSEAYECPLVPMENWLDARIEAGEKMYESGD